MVTTIKHLSKNEIGKTTAAAALKIEILLSKPNNNSDGLSVILMAWFNLFLLKSFFI